MGRDNEITEFNGIYNAIRVFHIIHGNRGRIILFILVIYTYTNSTVTIEIYRNFQIRSHSHWN